MTLLGNRTARHYVSIVAAAGAPILLAAAIAVAWLIGAQRTYQEENFRAGAQVILAAVDAVLADEITATKGMANSRELAAGDLDRFYDTAHNWLRNHPRWRAILVNDPEGREQLLSTNGPKGERRAAREPESILTAVETRAPAVGPLTRSLRYDDEFLFPIRVPVIVGDDVRYVVTVLIRPEAIAEILRSQASNDRVASVFDAERITVARSDDPGYVGQKAISDAFDKPGRLVIGLGLTGEPFARVLVQSPTSKWWVGVGMPAAAYYAPLRRNIWVVAVLTAAAGLISIALTLLVGRRIRRSTQAEEAARSQELEAAYATARKALGHAERASADKSRFLAAASHDLRQPIQAMQNLAHLLTRRLSGDEERLARRLDGAVRSSAALLNALLDISKLDAGVITPNIGSAPVASLVDPIVTDLRDGARAKRLDLRVVPCGLTVRSDPILLGSVIRNLVSNAIRYTEKGRILIGCRRSGDLARIEVWDTGIGIPEDQQDLIFEDFRQIDNPERDRDKGYGLGLAIVHRLAALLQHRLGLRSVPGKGTLFWVEVPLAEEAPRRIVVTAPPEPTTGRVLVIEDDVIQALSATMMLEEAGYEAVSAGSLDEALSVVRRFHPDVLLADFRLRGADGVEVVQRLRKQLGYVVPAVLVTGETSLAPFDAEMRMPILFKPYTPEQLAAIVQRQLSAYGAGLVETQM
ncbi:MAG TPA: ATP-binding protein [Alphaproteobacteria bacterium]|jgi:signal transduction histidine kinase/CheY-like chemotaxis protein|nr:ATP-binding protein [Alphaproteobacteria bacterium]